MVSLFDSITPKEMVEFQHQDNQIAPILSYVKQDQKIVHNKSDPS